jgi:hypothetical protein
LHLEHAGVVRDACGVDDPLLESPRLRRQAQPHPFALHAIGLGPCRLRDP